MTMQQYLPIRLLAKKALSSQEIQKWKRLYPARQSLLSSHLHYLIHARRHLYVCSGRMMLWTSSAHLAHGGSDPHALLLLASCNKGLARLSVRSLTCAAVMRLTL